MNIKWLENFCLAMLIPFSTFSQVSEAVTLEVLSA